VTKKSAQRGIAAPPLLIAGGVIVGLIVLLTASGALKFSGYVKVDQPTNQTSPEAPLPAAEQPTQEMTAPESGIKLTAYQGTDYTISYPEGWTVQSANSMVSITQKEPSAGILIITNPIGSLAGAKLATIADANKLVAKEQFKNANFLTEEEMELNGQSAWRYELTANNDGTDIKVIYYVLADSKNMYILMGTTTVKNWAELEGHLTASLDTFKLLQ